MKTSGPRHQCSNGKGVGVLFHKRFGQYLVLKMLVKYRYYSIFSDTIKGYFKNKIIVNKFHKGIRM